MIFETIANKIDCHRVRPNGAREKVVSFDEHLDKAPPHVRALLTEFEVAQLDKWLRERASVRAQSTDHHLFECLETLLREVQDRLYKNNACGVQGRRLKRKISDLLQALSSVKLTDANSSTKTQIGRRQLLKEHMAQLSENLA